MKNNTVKLEIDPFFISYNNEFFPLSPEGEPKELDDIPDYLVFDILGCIQPILMGEIYSFKFIDGPDILIVIPWGGETTLIFQTTNVVGYKNEHSITVPTFNLIYAILNAAKRMLDDVNRTYIFDNTRDKLFFFYERTKKLMYWFGYKNMIDE